MKGVKQSSRDSIGLLPVGLLNLLWGSPPKGGDAYGAVPTRRAGRIFGRRTRSSL